MTNYRLNEQHNGIEIIFDSKPQKATLDSLKQNGFRWHRGGGYWYAKQTEARLTLAKQISGEAEPIAKQTKAPSKPSTPKQNKFGVKVGDWFSAQWGYEQTNTNFFQVIALVGESSVRVREVKPEMVKQDMYPHGMAADRVYRMPKEIQPPCKHSTFIKDNEKGDLKRLKSYKADGVSDPQFYLSSFTDAYYCKDETATYYESWYA